MQVKAFFKLDLSICMYKNCIFSEKLCPKYLTYQNMDIQTSDDEYLNFSFKNIILKGTKVSFEPPLTNFVPPNLKLHNQYCHN